MIFSFLLPILVGGAGLFLLFRLRFSFILHPIRTARELISEFSDRSVRQSFFLALAGTLGVGNIFGISAGIMIGGAGCIFWLFISSIFAMIIKYSETLLVFDCKIERGGMSSALKHFFKRRGDVISKIYALLMLLLSLFMGSMMQSAAFLSTIEITLDISPLFGSIILLILITPCITNNGLKPKNITEIIIPLTTIIYITMCFGVIFANFSRLCDVFLLIIKSALSFRSVSGAAIFIAIKEGFARGILSNEAGTGTSAMAHSIARGRSPHRAGLFAMCEVFFDSLICILTGIAILISLDGRLSLSAPMTLVSSAFSSTFGRVSDIILPFIILAFAYSTIVCWFYYGGECASILHPYLEASFPLFFLLCILLSTRVSSSVLLYLIDLILLLMAIITLTLIIKFSSRIARLSACERGQKDPE